MIRPQQHQPNHPAQLGRLDLLLKIRGGNPSERVGNEFSIGIRPIVQVHDSYSEDGQMQEGTIISRAKVLFNNSARCGDGNTHIVSEALFVHPPAPGVEEYEESLEGF